MKLYRATTPKKVQRYHASGHRIIAPVRGFETLQAAMAWAMKTKRSVVLEIDVREAWKLPDHHNAFGCAFWSENDVTEWRCVVSPGKTVRP